jgi:hypothetical protein
MTKAMSKLIVFKRYVCYEMRDESIIDRSVEAVVAINPDHVVSVLPRKSSTRDDIFCSSEYFCHVVTANNSSTSVEGTLNEVVAQLQPTP